VTDRFSEAVDFAEPVLRHIIQDKKLRKTNIEPTEVLFSLALPVLNGTDERGMFLLCADEGLVWLVETAERDRGAFDLARRIVAARLIRNEPMPEKAYEFAGWNLAEVFNPPPRNKRALTFTNNVMLYWAAKRIEGEFDLKLTRGDENAALSSCDAVSEALKRIGHSKSYRAIKELCIHKSAAPMRQMAHTFNQILWETGLEYPEMRTYWQSQAPWKP